MSPSAVDASSSRWEALLLSLEEDVDTLVEEFLAALQNSTAAYGGTVDAEDLRSTAQETFLYLLDRLAGRPPRPDHGNIARRLGRRRAAQRVPVDALIAAVRLDFIVLWRHLRVLADSNDRDLLLDRTELLLTTIDTYIGDVQREFLLESARISGDARVATERHLGRLFREEPLSPAEVAGVASGLDVDPDADFDVAILQAAASAQTDPAIVDALTQGRAWGCALGEHFTVFHRADRASKRAWPELHRHGGLDLGRVAGLTGVRAAVLQGHALLLDAPPLDGPQDVQDLWHHHVARLTAESLPLLWEEITWAVEQLPRADRVVLLATVQRYMTSGSVKTTAGVLGCHRNTVVNRLRQFRDLTGLDATVPKEAALAWLLLSRVGA